MERAFVSTQLCCRHRDVDEPENLPQYVNHAVFWRLLGMLKTRKIPTVPPLKTFAISARNWSTGRGSILTEPQAISSAITKMAQKSRRRDPDPAWPRCMLATNPEVVNSDILAFIRS
jgi:hypothetical protein